MKINGYDIDYSNGGCQVAKDAELLFYSEGSSTVIIKEGIKSIRENCFRNDLSLKCVVLPDSIEEIGDGAFGGCKNLQCVILGHSLKLIGQAAFGKCENPRFVFFNGAKAEYDKVLRGEPFITLVWCLDGEQKSTSQIDVC